MTGFPYEAVADDRFPQEGTGTQARPQMISTLGRMRSASACFQRDHARHTTIPCPRMAAGPRLGTHYTRGVRRRVEPH